MPDVPAFFGPFSALQAAGVEVRPGAAWTAELYDLMETLEADLPLWLELARSSGSPALELGCGTGRVALPLARAGHRVLGVDADAAMLERLRAKLAEEEDDVRGRIELRRADALRLELGERFRLVVLANNFFNYFDLDDQRRLLRTVAEHLEPGGRLALDVYHPRLLPRQLLEGLAAVTRHDSEAGHDPEAGSTVLYLVQSREDGVRGTSWLNAYTSVLKDGAVQTCFLQSWRQRRTTANELRLLLRSAGFEPPQLFGGYDRRALDDDATQVLAVSRLPAAPAGRSP